MKTLLLTTLALSLPACVAHAQKDPSENATITLGVSNWSGKLGQSLMLSHLIEDRKIKKHGIEGYFQIAGHGNGRRGMPPAGVDYETWQNKMYVAYNAGLVKTYSLGRLRLFAGGGLQRTMRSMADPRDFDEISVLNQRDRLASLFGVSYTTRRFVVQLSGLSAPQPNDRLSGNTIIYSLAIGTRF